MFKHIPYKSLDNSAFFSLHLVGFEKPTRDSFKILNDYYDQLIHLNENVPIYVSTIDSEQLIVHKKIAFAEILHVLLYWFDFINQFETRILKTTDLHWAEFIGKYYPHDQDRLSTFMFDINFYDFVKRLVSEGLRSVDAAGSFSFPPLASLKKDPSIDKSFLFHENYKIFEHFYTQLQLPKFAEAFQGDLKRQIEQVQLFEIFYSSSIITEPKYPVQSVPLTSVLIVTG